MTPLVKDDLNNVMNELSRLALPFGEFADDTQYEISILFGTHSCQLKCVVYFFGGVNEEIIIDLYASNESYLADANKKTDWIKSQVEWGETFE